MNVRLMEISDSKNIAELEEKYFSLPWSEEAIVDSFNKDNYIFVVAAQDKEICAYCGMYTALDEGDITNIVVDEQYRRQGIGGKILNFAFNEAKKRGVNSVLLEVRKSNEKAIALYEKLGFENCGVRKNFYEKPVEDAYIMKIELS